MVRSMEMTVFCDVAPCRLVKNTPTFQGCLLPPSSWRLMTEAVSAPETPAIHGATFISKENNEETEKKRKEARQARKTREMLER
jgi:hypothetical protein